MCRVRLPEKKGAQAERRSGAWEAHGCGVFSHSGRGFNAPCRVAHPKGQERRKEKMNNSYNLLMTRRINMIKQDLNEEDIRKFNLSIGTIKRKKKRTLWRRFFFV